MGENLSDLKKLKNVKWITSNGAHIPIKNGESLNKALNDSISSKKYEKKQHNEIVAELKIPLYTQALGKKVLSNKVDISYEIRNNPTQHQNAFGKYKDRLTKIINEPDYIFAGNKPNRLLVVKNIKPNIEVVLQLSVNNPSKNNTVISMWQVSKETISRLEKSKQILYKK